MKDGKHVLCMGHDTEGEGLVPHVVSRSLCLMETRPGCSTCPNSRFVLRFQLRVADQTVACPRWASEEDRKNGQETLDYVSVQRDTCIRLKPFSFCELCPNSNPAREAMVERKWVEIEARRLRIERELDEEERDGRGM